MKKEEIYLDLSKLSEKEKEYVEDVTNQNTKDRNFIHFLEEKNKWLSFDSWDYDYIYKTEITFNQFKELFKPQLKIGDTFEHNGFICEVKSNIEVKKWFIVKNKITKSITYRYAKTDELDYFRNDTDLEVCQITDKEFINQLEKHAR